MSVTEASTVEQSAIEPREVTESAPQTNRGGNLVGRITEAPTRALVYLRTHPNRFIAAAGGAALAGLATLGIVSAARSGEPPTAENIKNIVDSYNQVNGGPPTK